MMYFSSNLKLLRKRRGKTQDDLAFALGLKRPTLSGYENGVAEPGLEILLKFSSYFNIALDTLLKVDLSILSENQLYQLEHGQDVYITGKELRVLATTVNQGNEDNIELVSEKARAGYANGFSDPEFISELQVFQLPFLSPNKKYRTFQLNGDSMLPIPDKSWVTGEFVQDWNNILNGEAYIILTREDGIVFKIVENRIKEDGKLGMFSLNPVYEAFDIKISDIMEVWRFVHFISSEIPDPVLPHDELVKTVANLKHEVENIKKKIQE
jgi:transcriptional regulator with XRE-family HTH domain